ncbi:hypothetical protein CFOL_v3_04173 [Cephalotus follicularis]|uniref:Reverse transcriptase domain-containing protein n=1 Tax=Cephalotus follicularis TaxID=3775 RepID=A0A1Q3AYB7_CEPFO|nr:hypothetical protein CFOL_v3_04173 [Cephalotus follicularis]
MQPLELVGPLSTSIPKLSIEETPKLDLKEFPSTLKYSFLGENQTLPVILSSDLTPSQEEKVIHLLKENKEAISWTMADIKGISPSVYEHRITLIEGSKPSREPQR